MAYHFTAFLTFVDLFLNQLVSIFQLGNFASKSIF